MAGTNIFYESPKQIRTMYMSLLAVTVMSFLVFRNLIICSRLLISSRRSVYVLSFLQSLLSIVCVLGSLTRLAAPWLLSCTALGYILLGSITLSEPIISYILLAKACAIQRRRFIALIGKAFIALACLVQMAGFKFLYLKGQSSVRCTWIPDSKWILAKCLIDLVNTTFLSVCFLSVMQRYRDQADHCMERAFRRLIRDGYLYAGCVIIIKLAITLIILFSSYGTWSTHLMGIDYLAASTLLVYQLAQSLESKPTRLGHSRPNADNVRVKSITIAEKRQKSIKSLHVLRFSKHPSQQILSPSALHIILSPIVPSTPMNFDFLTSSPKMKYQKASHHSRYK
ncbi:hypothetical protein BDF19DRAFT_463151 [Syncephalis fuscata]|nr:hypothetical protein BDF19DRAFT_463151 [Syncephalis fuscata]